MKTLIIQGLYRLQKKLSLGFIKTIFICFAFITLTGMNNVEGFNLFPKFSKNENNEIINGIRIPKFKPFNPANMKTPSSKPRFHKQISSLSDLDSARYQNIFAFQDNGEWQKSDAEITKLSDKSLMGYILHQRYMHPKYNSKYQELSDWMDSYYYLPVAKDVYKLALKKKTKSKRSPRRAAITKGLGGRLDKDIGYRRSVYRSNIKRSNKQVAEYRALTRSIRKAISSNRLSYGLDLVSKTKILDNVEKAEQRAKIAKAYFLNGDNKRAYGITRKDADKYGLDSPFSAWVAGLASWKNNDFKHAVKYFEMVASSKRSDSWLLSSGAYWAARANIRAKKAKNVEKWLKIAAENPRSFYGLIAARALGNKNMNYNWVVPALNSRYTAELLKIKKGKRAISLIDAGRPDLAELELKTINAIGNETLKEALVAVAQRYKMPYLSMQLGSAVKNNQHKLYDAALYPVMNLQEIKDPSIDMSLIHAFIRQESRFNKNAGNISGATGLMQIMPVTASYTMGLSSSYFKSYSGRKQLLEPEYNMKVGQKYLEYLLRGKKVKNNLFKLAVAYNAGPGNLLKFEKGMGYEKDPLLFIESIPVAETREFAKKVVSNYWIYQQRFNQKTPSLDQVAKGEWPIYIKQDIENPKFADGNNLYLQ